MNSATAAAANLAASAFRDERAVINRRKDALKGQIRQYKGELYDQKKKLAAAKADAGRHNHYCLWKNVPKHLFLILVKVYHEIKTQRAEGRLRAAQESFDFCLRQEGQQFMDECRFLGARV